MAYACVLRFSACASCDCTICLEVKYPGDVVIDDEDVDDVVDDDVDDAAMSVLAAPTSPTPTSASATPTSASATPTSTSRPDKV